MSRRVPRLTVLRIGLRLFRTLDRRRFSALLLAVAGVALCTLVTLQTAALTDLVGGRVDRTLARQPVRLSSIELDTSVIRGYFVEQNLDWRGESLTRFSVAVTDPGLPPPPGLPRWPRPDESFVSPTVAQELSRGSGIEPAVDGHVAGVVSDDGLRTATELLIWRGVHRAELGTDGLAFSEVGTREGVVSSELTSSQVRAVQLFFLICLVLPASALVGAGLRLNARSRQRRIRALRILGLRSDEVSRIDAIEGGFTLVLGFVAGCLAYAPLNTALASSGIMGFRWFSMDTALSVPLIATAIAILGSLGAITIRYRGAVARRPAISINADRTRIPSRRVALWRTLPLAVGIAGLPCYVVFMPYSGQSQFLQYTNTLVALTALIAVGLLWSLPAVVHVASRYFIARASQGGTRLGYARLKADPGPVFRLVGGVGVIVFALGVGIGYSQQIRQLHPPDDARPVVAVNANAITSDAARRLASTPGVLSVLTERRTPVHDGSEQWPQYAVFGTCAQLRTLITENITTCGPGAAFPVRAAPGENAVSPAVGATTLSFDGGHTQQVDVSATAVTIRADMARWIYSNTVLVASAAPEVWSVDSPESSQGFISVAIVLDGTMDPWLAYAQVVAASSAAPITWVGFTAFYTEQVTLVQGVVRFCFFLAAVILLLVLLVTVVDRSSERRRSDTALLALGAPVTLIRMAHRAEVAVPVLIGFGLAVGCGIIGGVTWNIAGGGQRGPAYGSYLLLVAFVAVLWSACVAAAHLVATKRCDVSLVRRD